VGVVVNMTDGVAVGNGPGVQRSVVAAGTSWVPCVGQMTRNSRSAGPYLPASWR
jgi:hypothetical protein